MIQITGQQQWVIFSTMRESIIKELNTSKYISLDWALESLQPKLEIMAMMYPNETYDFRATIKDRVKLLPKKHGHETN